ncbi:MAG: DUF2461 domain-containing protein [Microcella sp.]|uniref:DUF2461 domain-containing protein n=1 Tax=Microcella sp. TaxID=1913979 RepID=UPI003314B8D2
MTFAGFDSDAFAFYDELEAHNTREWWLAHKSRYDEHVRGPVAALVDELGAEFGAIKIFRPNRDVRFSADKSPYKTQVSFVTQSTTGAAHYLQLSSEGVMIAGGYYQPASDQLGRFRALVDDNRLAGDLEATLEEAGEGGFEVFDSDALVTAPRGFSVDHPRIDLLRLRNLAIRRTHRRDEEWLTQPVALERIRQAWRTVSIWNEWLAENVGPSVNPPRSGPGAR